MGMIQEKSHEKNESQEESEEERQNEEDGNVRGRCNMKLIRVSGFMYSGQ